ncbi:MAG: hypothetical protein A3H98_12885 [Bacteroidetes bacterium RIFCSPLOWO2_02_FULL_36_8]|nr:MAG: hypothetical protein A3H98_12885 [Bacteroidetes bacterium RIFCSPLOWO2_02_FULL_36_8]OFY70631.1 MAG: hypothetical protein A3G23_07840 [Bacteroidetes bacterium RIFCSPLOWO2_12_FULL_37_12]
MTMKVKNKIQSPLLLKKINYEICLQVLDNMLEGCQIFDSKWRYLYINPAAEKHNRRSSKELIGHSFKDAWPGIEKTEVYKVMRLCMEKRSIQSTETEFIYPDGKKGWFELRVEPIPEGLFILSIDITGRKQVEKQLKDINNRFDRLVSQLNDIVWTASSDGSELIDINDSFERVYGYSVEEFKKNPLLWLEMVHPDDKKIAEESSSELKRNGTASAEYRIVRPDGEIKWILDRKSILYDEKGKIYQMGGIAKDITERKNLEKQLLHAQRMESIGTLAGGIAHDLNNVLSPVLLSVGILKEKLPDEQSQKMLRMVESSVQRGAELIKQVLLFARGVEGERSPTQVSHIINEVSSILKQTLSKTISLETEVSKNLPTVNADATQIHQVLMNLCVNASDAMPNGGKLEITAESIILDEQYARMNLQSRPGPYLLITVSDQGSGIPASNLERIFEPFFTTKGVGKGTGLGLSTVQAIIKSHKGFVKVYSEVGKGSVFKVYLPVVHGEQIFTEKKVDEILTGNGELILFVDDEESIREITKETLSANKYKVITASNGTEAVAEYASNGKKIVLVITDMMMPYMDGTATIRALQKLNPEVKILAVSGLKQSSDIVKQKTVKFLQKPYTAEKLLKSIRDLIYQK